MAANRHVGNVVAFSSSMRRVLNQTANAAARTKKKSSKSGIAAQSRAWDTTKPSGPLPIDSVD
jgi:hypothetical protein